MKESLPVELGPDAINMLRRQRMERNRLAEPTPQTWSKMTQLWGGGYYTEFEYIPDEYGRKQSFENDTRQVAVGQREKISKVDWRYTSQDRRLKHETLINNPLNKETYPYLGGDQDAEREASKQWNRGVYSSSSPSGTWSQERAQLGSETSFLAGKGKGLEDNSRGSRMMLQIIVQRLERRLAADWEGTNVAVLQTPEDLVQVAFQMATVDSERGVLAYMNVLSKDGDLLGPAGLRKVSQLWGMKRDVSADAQPNDSLDALTEANPEQTWIFFLLMPKWVRMRPTDAYYTLNPRAEGSAFRMSTAGSSVLLSLGNWLVDPTDGAMRKESVKDGTEASGGAPQSARGPPLPSSARMASNGLGSSARVDLSVIEKAVTGLSSSRSQD
jgi:hypothetical protein